MITPYFTVLSSIAPKINQLVENCKQNCENYKEMVDHYEDQMNKGNILF